ncbi:alpha-ketoglutarate-dependent dioxygenase AlkB family protein [Ulvibacter litoralis]|uniref:Alkylated DNA repair dioxygenase AlkB n=1 Tax=Ulvibacter litoralis TaxID=227084 RepID=A0A1G7IWA4_9FLAO|nr:alpha-ketoglutarate-dependent dioxygenase AlkB [Ulvibacter litoralis]GHC64930.1 alpha-ketoglutarate-dependent dioxygenase AlkB [Ulvibacter litoralis]SDF16866.1 Alkylated DNA repair dioxygenase AlkB [Ulvibacter litoralis]
MNLFASEEHKTPLQLPIKDGTVLYIPSFFSSEKASEYFTRLTTETPWQQDSITLFGKTHPQPRLTALYGNNSKPYSYSGITMLPKQFTPTLKEIKCDVEKFSEVNFTTVLLNLYRNGSDSNGWHSDNEKELGTNPVIASVSFGAPRMFHLKHKTDKALKHKIILEHGSLLLMKGATQENWLHQIPKTTKRVAPRINLTFRIVY